MKTHLLRLAFATLLGMGAMNLHAQSNRTINFTSPALEIGTTSLGAALDASYTFALGSFGAFTPTTANESSWMANFNSLGSTPWDAANFTQYSGADTLTTNASPFSLTNQAYVWGYNTQTIAGGTQWILLTNASWTFPAIGVAQPPVNWDASDAGTVAVVGFISSAAVGTGANPYLQTASISAPIPEPSTYAAIFGVAALGFVAYRRRQQAA